MSLAERFYHHCHALDKVETMTPWMQMLWHSNGNGIYFLYNADEGMMAGYYTPAEVLNNIWEQLGYKWTK